MRKSMRLRLQAWYALVLLLVVGGLASILYYQLRATLLNEAERRLIAAAEYIDVALRRFPPHELEGGIPEGRPMPPPPPEGNENGRGPPPVRPPDRERLLHELTPPEWDHPDPGDNSLSRYFAIWLADGSLLHSSNLQNDISRPQPPTVDRPFRAPPFGTEAAREERKPPPRHFGGKHGGGEEKHPPPRFGEESRGEKPPRPRFGPEGGGDGPPRFYFKNAGDYGEAVGLGPMSTTILVGKSMRPERQELQQFAWQLAAAGAIVLAVGLTGGWLISARILKPVQSISATASAISVTNLTERIDDERVDKELAELVQVLNAMFDRLEAAFAQQVRFTADASHELRTPLAIIRSHAELALARQRSNEEYRQTLETCLHACSRMTDLVEGLLILARADAGKLDIARDPIDLKPLVEETLGLLRPMASAKGLRLELTGANAQVQGDGGRLAQVFTNLVTNAIQYNRPGGAVRVGLHTDSGWAVVSVQDTGTGIPEASRAHIFERFYRVDKARSRSSGGQGLGLAISKSIVEALGGTIDFESKLNHGTTFRVFLPCRHSDINPA
jgi:heavy metal sensor kinase